MRTVALALAIGLLGVGSLEAQEHQHGQAPGRGQQPGMMGGMGAMGGMGMMEGMGMMGMMGPMAELASFAPARILEHRGPLELTDEQVAALTTLQEETGKAAEDAHAPAHAAMEALQQEFKADAPDLDRVRQLFTAHQTAMGNVQLLRLEAALKAKTLLTPEQRGIVKGLGMHDGPGMPHGHQEMMRD